MGALLAAAGIGTFVKPAARPFVFGATLTFALGVLLHLTLIAKDGPVIVPALAWATVPDYSAGASWRLDNFSLCWAIITLVGAGVPLLTITREPRAVAESAWTGVALAVSAPLILSGDVIASAVLLSLLLGSAAFAALKACEQVDRADAGESDASGSVAVGDAHPQRSTPSTPSDHVRCRLTILRRLLLDQVSIVGLVAFASATSTARGTTADWIGLLMAAAGTLLLVRVYPVHTVGFGAPTDQSWRVLLSFLGIFLLFRVMASSTVGERGLLDDALLVLGLFTTIAGVLDAYGARDVREWSARTVPADVGIAVVAIAIGAPLSIPILAIVTFGRLFGGAALALGESRSSQPHAHRRTWRDDTNAGALALAFGTLAGFPPFPGFIARTLLVQALLGAGAWLAAAIVVACLALLVSSGLAVVGRSLAARPVGAASSEPPSHQVETAMATSALPVLLFAAPLVAFALLPTGPSALANWLTVTQPHFRALTGDEARLSLPGLLLSAVGLLGGYLLAASRDLNQAEAAAMRPSRLLAPFQNWPAKGPRLRVLEGLVEAFRRLEDDRYLPAAIFLGVIVILAFVR